MSILNRRVIYGVGICSAIVGFLFTTIVSYAQQIRITEVLYDAEGSDVGKEYVEIINLGPEVVQATDIVFVEHGRRHKVQAGSGKEELAPGEIAVIVHNVDEFKEAYPSYRGIIFDSSFSLRNTESTLELLVGENTVHSIAYQEGDGGSGNGESLHISSRDNILSGATTIGVVSSKIRELVQERTNNTRVSSTNSNAQDEGSSKKEESTSGNISEASVRATSEVIKSEKEQLTFTIEPDILFTASESIISLKKPDRTPIYGVWNFGNGRYEYGDEVTHAYTYPGKYIITFEVVDVYDEYKEDIFFQKTIQVINPEVHIERIDDLFIRFVNTHSFAVDISDWMILSDEKIFTFPKNSFIQAHAGINIPFITKKGNDIFFITKGGGQFLGYQEMESNEEAEGGISSAEQMEIFDPIFSDMATISKGIEGFAIEVIKGSEEGEDKTAQEEEVLEEELEKTEEKGAELQEHSVGISKDISGLAKETAQEERQIIRKEKLQKLIQWLTLLIGLIALAAAPFFLEKKPKKKNIRRRIQNIKNN